MVFAAETIFDCKEKIIFCEWFDLRGRRKNDLKDRMNVFSLRKNYFSDRNNFFGKGIDRFADRKNYF